MALQPLKFSIMGSTTSVPIIDSQCRRPAAGERFKNCIKKGMCVNSSTINQPKLDQAAAGGMPVDVVIMAAGKGTRMKSRLPKVLHRIAGRALLAHVMDTASALMARNVVVITGHGADEVEAAVAAHTTPAGVLRSQCVRQEPQLGTGHAVQQAVPVLADDGIVVVLSGDVPLTQPDTLFHLIAACQGQKLALLTL